jgi:excisionase family DNA binding protein
MDTDRTPAGGLEPVLSIEDLADYLGVPVTTLYDWRVGNKGPRGIRVGRHVKFLSATCGTGWPSSASRRLDASGAEVMRRG